VPVPPQQLQWLYSHHRCRASRFAVFHVVFSQVQARIYTTQMDKFTGKPQIIISNLNIITSNLNIITSNLKSSPQTSNHHLKPQIITSKSTSFLI
jgi:hypothetical protein